MDWQIIRICIEEGTKAKNAAMFYPQIIRIQHPKSIIILASPHFLTRLHLELFNQTVHSIRLDGIPNEKTAQCQTGRFAHFNDLIFKQAGDAFQH